MTIAVAESHDLHTAAEVSPVLSLKSLSKNYGSHRALKSIDMELFAGEVVVLFGENGAGKSTLISLIAGALAPTTGTIKIDGEEVEFSSVAHARVKGVRAVFQEFSLIPHLTVADNITLGEELLTSFGLLDKAAMRKKAAELIKQLGFDLDENQKLCDLSRGKQQMVEICKAALQSPRVLILDEPTASLSEHDTQALFRLIKEMTAAGTAIIYITHRMHEIHEIGDRVVVLRDGELITTVPATTPSEELITFMTGRSSVSDIYPELVEELGEKRLCVTELSNLEGSVNDVSFNVRAGEIVGLAGLVGCGKSEVGQTIYSLLKRKSGKVFIDGVPSDFKHPADAIKAGLWYSPPDRARDGLALVQPACDNMIVSTFSFGKKTGYIRNRQDEKELISYLSDRVEFPTIRANENVSSFSGGNQQKVLLAKSLAQDIEIFIFDEPTVGVDVGTRQVIYEYLNSLSRSGAAILLISSDLPELIGLSHRILVMRDSSIVSEFNRGEYDQKAILEQFFGNEDK